MDSAPIDVNQLKLELSFLKKAKKKKVANVEYDEL